MRALHTDAYLRRALLIAAFASTVLGQDVGPVEIVFSFDTTGSMYPVLEQVRQGLAELIRRLQSDIPGIRMAVFAHGDYADDYVSKWVDFTTDATQLRQFVKEVARTGGGDLPEAYELVLQQVHQNLSWTEGSQRSLVMIGDNVPHPKKKNPYGIDWKKEARQLAKMGVRIYSVRALDYESEEFYRSIANITGGYYLELKNFGSIFDFILAISYREYGLEFLEAYESEVRERPGGITPEMEELFNTLRQQRVEKRPKIPRNRTVTAPPVPTTTATPPPARSITVNKDMDIYSMHIESRIAYRFATTTVKSKLANRGNNASEAVFLVQLPKAAFIANFSMEIDGTTYEGEVKEKEVAKRTYERAKKKGETAGHLVAVPRHSNSFEVAVNVAAESKVTFTFIYQELLQRRLGMYEHVIHVDPGQIVRDLSIVVNIHESRKISFVRVPPLRNDIINIIDNTDENQDAIIEILSQNEARVTYRPTPEEQEAASAHGLQGQFIVQYDVDRTEDASELQVVDGYFVHFFAPENLPSSPKNVMFVLDTSGSMSGEKLSQLKDAMTSIIDQLNPSDHFNILAFSSFFRYWREDMLLPATQENKDNAKEWINNMFAAGGTNINSALLKGLRVLATQSSESLSGASILVFLTDGQATYGETNLKNILSNIKTENHNTSSMIFGLGFGNEVDFRFLQKLSLQNNGLARKIYADSDAAAQLKGFYNEIASPVLSQVKVKYLDDKVNETSLTTSSFTTIFDGSEIICSGILVDPEEEILSSEISANSVDGPLTFTKTIRSLKASLDAPTAEGLRENLERIWAYQTIKNLLDESLKAESKEEKERIRKEALTLSLKYHFVTPLTSMVVKKPEAVEAEDLVDPDAAPTPTDKPAVHVSKRGHSTKDRDLIAGEGLALRATELPSVHHSIPRRPPHRGSFADNDPHFLTDVAGSDVPICFDIMGHHGDVFQLLTDHMLNLTVNAEIVAKINPKVEDKKQKTYFGKIAILHNDVKVILNPRKIRLGNTALKWKVNQTAKLKTITLQMRTRNQVVVSIDNRVVVMVMRHLVRHKHPSKVDFLGFYIENGTGLSANVHGLLGQFQTMFVHVNANINETKDHEPAMLTFPSKPYSKAIKVYAGHRENMATKEKVRCWFVRSTGRGLIDGSPKGYQIPRLTHHKQAKATIVAQKQDTFKKY